MARTIKAEAGPAARPPGAVRFAPAAGRSPACSFSFGVRPDRGIAGLAADTGSPFFLSRSLSADFRRRPQAGAEPAITGGCRPVAHGTKSPDNRGGHHGSKRKIFDARRPAPRVEQVGAYAWKALAGSAIGYAMDGFDLLILGFMLPAITAALHRRPGRAARWSRGR